MSTQRIIEPTQPIILTDDPGMSVLISRIRNSATTPKRRRELMRQVAFLLANRAASRLPILPYTMETAMGPTSQGRQFGAPIATVPILRAGLGMHEGVTDQFPGAATWMLGLRRNEETAIAEAYYDGFPDRISPVTWTILMDPMLATGGSMSSACEAVIQRGGNPDRMIALCVIGCPEGLARIAKDHPRIQVILAAQDEGLNEKFYIVGPGLGDAGDLMYPS